MSKRNKFIVSERDDRGYDDVPQYSIFYHTNKGIIFMLDW